MCPTLDDLCVFYWLWPSVNTVAGSSSGVCWCAAAGSPGQEKHSEEREERWEKNRLFWSARPVDRNNERRAAVLESGVSRGCITGWNNRVFPPPDLLERNDSSMFQMGACIQTPIINHPVGGKWKIGLHSSNFSLYHSIPWIPLLHWRHWEQLLPTFLRLSFSVCVCVCVNGVCKCICWCVYVCASACTCPW